MESNGVYHDCIIDIDIPLLFEDTGLQIPGLTCRILLAGERKFDGPFVRNRSFCRASQRKERTHRFKRTIITIKKGP